MIHFASIIHLIAIIAGAAAFGIFFLLWHRSRQILWRDYLLFHVAYSLVMAIRIVGQYLQISGSTFSIQDNLAWYLLTNFIGIAALIFTMPRFFQSFFPPELRMKYQKVFPPIALATILSAPLVLLPLDFFLFLIPMVIGMGGMVFMLLYTQIHVIRNLAKLRDRLHRLSVPAILIYNFFCIIAAVIDALVEENQLRSGEFPVGLALQALVYIVWNCLTILWAISQFDTTKAATPLVQVQNLVLSQRENEIVTLVAEGLSNKEIAGRLNLSGHTIRNHLHGMFQKTGAKSRVDLLRRIGSNCN